MSVYKGIVKKTDHYTAIDLSNEWIAMVPVKMYGQSLQALATETLILKHRPKL
jgi:hypothetical protein